MDKLDYKIILSKLYEWNVIYIEDYFNNFNKSIQVTYNPIKYTYGLEVQNQKGSIYEVVNFGMTFEELCSLLDTFRK